MKTKICKICKKEKLITEFHKGNDRDGFRYECIICRVLDSKLYYQNNKERIKKQTKEYSKTHKIESKEYGKYYKNFKRKTDINFRLLECLRSRLLWALKNNSKVQRTINLIGCDINFLKQHLESQFKDGMSWSNYGKWHIDHIRPCASFDLSKPEEQQKCFYYKNLRPLWKIDNLRRPKGAKHGK